MYRRRLLSILILFVAVCTVCFTGAVRLEAVTDSTDLKSLTLEKAIDIALESNLRLKQTTNLLKSDELNVVQKRANFLPDLNASSQWSERFGKSYSQLTGNKYNQTSGSLSFNASTSLNIFNGFYDKASLQQAVLELNASRQNLVRSRQDVIFNTIQRFTAVITAREMIGVEKENLEAQKVLLNQIEDFYKLGKRPVTDFYQQKSLISKAEYDLLTAQRNFDVAKLLLMQTMGLQPSRDFEVVDPGIDSLVKNIITFQQQEAIREAFAKRPDLNAQQLLIDASRQGIVTAKAGYWPKLSFSAGLGTNYTAQNQWGNFSDQFFNGNLSGSFGFTLSIPIFDKARTRTNVALAFVNLKNQQLELETIKQQMEVDVQQAIEDYETAAKQLDVAEAQLKYSKDALDSIQERYNVSAATMTDLSQARAQYLESGYNRIQARFNLVIRGVAISYYKGDGDAMIKFLEKK